MTIPEGTGSDGKLATAVGLVKGLSLTNVLIIALLVVIAIPAYVTYRALNEPEVMDRLMSSYREYPNQLSGCTLREVKERGGPEMWSVSSGFAFHGGDRWYVAVGLSRQPTTEEITSHCAALKLIADKLVGP